MKFHINVLPGLSLKQKGTAGADQWCDDTSFLLMRTTLIYKIKKYKDASNRQQDHTEAHYKYRQYKKTTIKREKKQ